MMNNVEILCGDCRLILPTLAGGSIGAIVTDPPYGTEVARDGYGRRQNYGGVGRKIEGDSDLSALAGMLDGAGRVLAKHAWIAAFCSPKRHAEVASLLETKGFPIRGEVVWDKEAPGLGGGIRYQHELILLAAHGDPSGRASLFSVVREYLSRGGKERRHPHEKPVKLMTRLIRYCTDEGQTVLDPFMGSGSTPVACLKTGRRCLGIELDPDYWRIAERRIEEARMPLLDLLSS
jgi:site-specific DNA-methyltransferase (adenine-specific)